MKDKTKWTKTSDNKWIIESKNASLVKENSERWSLKCSHDGGMFHLNATIECTCGKTVRVVASNLIEQFDKILAPKYVQINVRIL